MISGNTLYENLPLYHFIFYTYNKDTLAIASVLLWREKKSNLNVKLLFVMHDFF